MKYWQRGGRMQGWVVYERCRERIVVRLPTAQNGHGTQWRPASCSGTRQTEDGVVGQSPTRWINNSSILADPMTYQPVNDDENLYRGSLYEDSPHAGLGNDLLDRGKRQSSVYQDPALSDIDQTSFQQNPLYPDTYPEFDHQSSLPDSLETKELVQHNTDDDWQELCLSHCLDSGNVWKLCWEVEQIEKPLSPIVEEGRSTTSRYPEPDEVDTYLSSMLEDCQSTTTAQCPCPRDSENMGRPLSPILEEDQQPVTAVHCSRGMEVRRYLFPKIEEKCLSITRVQRPKQDALVGKPLSPILEEECLPVYTAHCRCPQQEEHVCKTLSPIVEEECPPASTVYCPQQDERVGKTLSPILEEECLFDTTVCCLQEDGDVDRPLSPIFEEECLPVFRVHCPQDEDVGEPLSPIFEEEFLPVTIFECPQQDRYVGKLLPHILEEECLSVTEVQCPREAEDEKLVSPLLEEGRLSASTLQCPQEDEEDRILPTSEEDHQSGTILQSAGLYIQNGDSPFVSEIEDATAGVFLENNPLLFLDDHTVCDKTEGNCEDAGGGGEEVNKPAIHAWYLVDPKQKKLRLPRTMLFLGRDECDIIIQSGTVDKRHAVITFDLYLSRFKVKDLSTTNGTYVNESRIPEQEYVTLNHMDTVRLGYDSKVYHMEQGEPCTGDSPSPPGTTCIPPQHPSSLQHQATCSAAPVSSLSSSSYLMGAGESPSTTKGGSSSALEAAALPPPPPLWSSRHSHDRDPQHMMIMAECQGCIAEQRIEHTCTHAPNPTTTTTAPPHHHHHHDNSSHSPRFVEVQRKSNNTQSSHTEKPVGLGQGNCGFFPAAEKEEELDPTEADADDPLEAALPEETVRLGRNTWPRKKLRQARRAATDLFGDDCDGMVDDEEIAVESGSNYFVSVDDSAVCESASAGVRGSGRMVVEYSLSRTGSVHRIPRNSKNVPLPPLVSTVHWVDRKKNRVPATHQLEVGIASDDIDLKRLCLIELETVKKGSSLYGQPSWWGEDTDNGDKEGAEASQPKGEAKSPRPSSLVVQGHAADAGGPQPHPPPQKQKKKTQHPKDAKPVYMEIPHHSAATPERDKPPLQQQRDKCTPARSISSLSKDSLVVSPDSARGRSVDKESDSGGKAGTGSGSGGEGAAGNPALSFTVEFGDEKAKKPKLKSGASLSQFVPPKLRSSLSSHCRSEKAASSSRDGSCKNSEERELSSPVAIVKQRKQEEHTPSGGAGEAPSKGKSARRSSGQGTGVGSLRSSDFSSETTPPGSVQSRRETERRPSKEAEKEMDKKPPKPQEPRKTTSRPPTSKGSKAAKAQPSAAAIAASVQAAQYSDPTAYLIERMFAGATDSPRSESSEPERSDSPAAPEHAMYKEARQYDRASQRGSATYRASSNSSSKPTPQQKQKSLSRSPAASNGKSPAGPKSSPKSPASPKTPKTTAAAATKPLEKQPSLLKEKSAESDRPRATASATAVTAAACAPQALPKAPSPITAGGDQEDKVSEAGTYTIEAEEDGEEELMARQQIDEIYGVTDVNSFSFERPIIASRENVQGSQEDEEEKTLHEDLEGASVKTGCHTPCDDDETEKIFDDDIEEDENGDLEEEAPVEEEGVMSRSIGDEEVPSWVSQLNSLTAGIRQSPAKDAMAKGTEDASKKSSQGLSRKRPGTGRKLPSIPTADQSPVSSEHSAHHNSPDSPANAQNGARSSSLVENGHDRSTDDSPSRNVGFSPVVSASGAVSGKSRLEGSPCGSEGSGTNNINSVAIPKGSLMCSRGSTDTELLLRDTETVMAAMEARMGFNQEDRRNREDDGESDSDLTSTVAMVNGDEDFIKPTKYHSPRDTMTGKVSKNKDNSNIRIAASSRKTMARSFSEQKPPVKSERSPRSTAGVSVVSDVLSRSNSLDQSFQSDASDGGSSDRTDTTFSRSGSRGKGTITMAKPNRAFALRRALADGSETADTARSRGSAPSTAASASSRRSSSIHGTPRTSYSDRTGTEASLGAQIVKKAREKTGTPKGRESSITRQDGVRRNSLRGADRRSSASSTASSTVSSAKKERDIRTLKSQLRSTPGNRDLAITGVGSSRSQSQPGSRSNSPKAAERMAWKRRKEYDPRKSVAEARASKAKEPRPKPKVQATSLYKQRMTRSASFTNSAELSGRARHDTYNVESISSAEDLSSAATVSEPYGETGFRRAFIPFHNPRRSDRLIHSADEDEAGPFPVSQDPVNSSKPPTHPVSLMLYKSAFTPPLSKLHTPSPDSPSPSLVLRRRTLGASDFEEARASTALSSHRIQADCYSTHSSSPQSYDSLIVSSIYQLTLKLKTTMDKTLVKLREQDRASITPSPIDDFLGHTTRNEIPAWKSANQELAGVLKNLRMLERQFQSMDRALFPDEDTDTDVSGMSSTEKHKYYQEIERIRSELAGFHPIDSPHSQSVDPGSPEMAELSKNVQ